MRRQTCTTRAIWLGLATAPIFMAGLSGCGTSNADTLLPVEGQVRFAGKPLTKGTVILYPDASKGNQSQHEPRGSIEAEGRFKIITHPHVGAAPGWYKVAVKAADPSDAKNPYSLPRSLIPEKFGNPQESGLKLQVRPDAPAGHYDLNLN